MDPRVTLPPKSDPERIRFRDVLGIRAFAALYFAEAQSIVGDQLARVALSVLVYERTGSTVDTGVVYALTFLPAIFGGGVLSGLADRYSRKRLMVSVDCLRAALIASMAIPNLNVGFLIVPLVLAVFIGPAFNSAEVSLVASIMDAEHYRTATGLRLITGQVAQVGGFAIGGVLVGLVGSRQALFIDAITFAVSALTVAFGVRQADVERPSGRHRAAEAIAPVSLSSCLGVLWRDRTVRALIGLSWLAGFFVAPEGLAVPYARDLGHGTAAAGALLTAIPLGSVIGAFVLLRAFAPVRRQPLIAPLAVLAGVPLIICVANPPLVVSLALWTLSGLFTAYEVDAITNVIQLTGESWRGRTASILNSGLIAAQGLGLSLFALIATALTPGRAIALAGLAGSAGGLTLWSSLHRAPGSSASRTGPDEGTAARIPL
jgi:predicted MFS family arabinose efflux permease